MQPILSTILDISSFKPFSVAVPGGGGGAVQPCLYRTVAVPTQTKQYSNSIWLHACNLFRLYHKQFEVYKILLLMHVGATY